MGCVVFHYDMVGYADSKQIAHRTGFTDAEAELRRSRSWACRRGTAFAPSTSS